MSYLGTAPLTFMEDKMKFLKKYNLKFYYPPIYNALSEKIISSTNDVI